MERMLDLMHFNNPHKDKSPDSFNDFCVPVSVNMHAIEHLKLLILKFTSVFNKNPFVSPRNVTETNEIFSSKWRMFHLTRQKYLFSTFNLAGSGRILSFMQIDLFLTMICFHFPTLNSFTGDLLKCIISPIWQLETAYISKITASVLMGWYVGLSSRCVHIQKTLDLSLEMFTVWSWRGVVHRSRQFACIFQTEQYCLWTSAREII